MQLHKKHIKEYMSLQEHCHKIKKIITEPGWYFFIMSLQLKQFVQ